MKLRSPSISGRSGLTIFELSVSMVVYVAFAGTLLLIVLGSQRAEESVEDRLIVAREAMRAMDALRLDAQRSGWTTVGGDTWPMIDDAAVNPTDWAAFDHAAPAVQAGADASRPCYFRVLEDADDNGWPDLAGGQTSWANQAVAWMIVPGNDGRNSLVRRLSDGRERTFSERARSIVFEDPADTGYTIPLDAIRVTLEFELDDSDDTYRVEETIALRNGGMAP